MFKFVKVVLINMVAILMKSAELVTLGQPHPQDALGMKMTLGLLKIKAFQNKGYDVIIPVHDVTKIFYHVTQIRM